MPPEEHAIDDAGFQRIAKALADPRRREILEIIARSGEMSCGEMVERLPLTQATVSHHLKELVEAGLVTMREERQYNYYGACPVIVERYAEELRRRLSCPLLAADAAPQDTPPSDG